MFVGVLHPGAMGSAVGAALMQKGVKVLWASEGRSQATKDRALRDGLEDVGTMLEVAKRSAVILSICPPDQASAVVQQALAAGFKGTYVDANAVAPSTTDAMCAAVTQAGATFVDGGIIGGPPRTDSHTTRLYISGPSSAMVGALFEGTKLDAIVMNGPVGAASALKMCYAAWTKGSSALLFNIRALASHHDVEASLMDEWQKSQTPLLQKCEQIASTVPPKAWRWTGEMNEIATTFADASLPSGFHEGAEEVYRRMAGFKDDEIPPTMPRIVDVLKTTPPP